MERRIEDATHAEAEATRHSQQLSPTVLDHDVDAPEDDLQVITSEGDVAVIRDLRPEPRHSHRTTPKITAIVRCRLLHQPVVDHPRQRAIQRAGMQPQLVRLPIERAANSSCPAARR